MLSGVCCFCAPGQFYSDEDIGPGGDDELSEEEREAAEVEQSKKQSLY